MIPEIGHFSLALALVLATCQAFFPLYGAWQGKLSWMAVARPAAYGQFLFLLFAFICLEYGFAVNDFTVAYIAQTSNSYLPWYYKFSAVWGGHEGSLLLWALVLGAWTAAVATFNRGLPMIMIARVLGIMGLIAIGFISFLLFTSNPFTRLLPDFPAEGADLNPLLQDPGLIIHPPMLYMGYVGFSVAFSFALAGLLGGRLDSAWARWSRPWTIVAWCFLTIGIALGSWWAYYELGWGGWWFWDPVENASFMPWLAGTALIHSLAVTEKRGVFKAWTVLLSITAFSLSLLGTFLVRSGVLTSVHAFASDPTRGMFVLVFLLIVVGGSLAIFGLRASVLRSESNYELVSREMFLLLNNFILVVCSITVLLGTLYPIIADVLHLGKLSVGAPYFNMIFVPLALLLLFFVAIGPYSHWKKHNLNELMLPLWKILGVSVVAGVLLPLSIHGAYQIRAALAFSLVIWVALATLNDVLIKARVRQFGVWRGWNKLSRSYKGMVVAHLGLAMSFVGVTFASLYSVERDVRMAKGDSAEIGPYQFKFNGVKEVRGANYIATQGLVDVYLGDKLITTLAPEKRTYRVRKEMMTEAAIDPGFTRDLYVAMGEPLENGAWAVRLYYKPFVRWMWLGALVMAVGGVIAISDPRYRAQRRTSKASLSDAATTV